MALQQLLAILLETLMLVKNRWRKRVDVSPGVNCCPLRFQHLTRSVRKHEALILPGFLSSSFPSPSLSSVVPWCAIFGHSELNKVRSFSLPLSFETCKVFISPCRSMVVNPPWIDPIRLEVCCCPALVLSPSNLPVLLAILALMRCHDSQIGYPTSFS